MTGVIIYLFPKETSMSVSINPANNNAYGLSQPLINVFPAPIISKRTPTTADKAQIGTVWIVPASNAAYILVSIVANSATWNLLESGGSGGSFSTLTSTGATTLATTGASVNTFGNTTGATSVTISAGTGGLFLDGATTTSMVIGFGLVGGAITIGGAVQTGTITLGSSSGVNEVDIGTGEGATTVDIATGATAAKTVNIGTGAAMANTLAIGGTGANVITIGNTQTGGSVSIGAAMTSGTLNLGGTGLQVGTVTLAGGTGAQIVNIGTGGTGVKTIHIGDGAIGNLITIGSTTAAAATTIQAASGGIILSSAGNVKMAPGTVSAAAYAATLSTQVGQVTLTGQVLGNGAAQVLTITNTLCTTSTPIQVTVCNLGTNNAQLTVTRVQPKAGSFEVTVFNNGAAALNGDIQVNFWLLS